MLRISKLADYGTVVMVCLAIHDNELLNAKFIAEQIQLAAPTVSKLLKLLAAAGLLQSIRGAKGGYRLSRPATAISVADIITAVEGKSGLTECSLTSGDCNLEPVCNIRHNWQKISSAIYTALDSVTLAELAKPKITTAAVDVSAIKCIFNQPTK